MSDKTPSAILFEAADIVSEGWTHGSMVSTIDGKSCYCALGAIACAKTGRRYTPAEHAAHSLWPIIREDEAVRELAIDLGWTDRNYEDAYTLVYSWNDEEHRTPDEVEAQLRSTAQRLANAGR